MLKHSALFVCATERNEILHAHTHTCKYVHMYSYMRKCKQTQTFCVHVTRTIFQNDCKSISTREREEYLFNECRGGGVQSAAETEMEDAAKI